MKITRKSIVTASVSLAAVSALGFGLSACGDSNPYDTKGSIDATDFAWEQLSVPNQQTLCAYINQVGDDAFKSKLADGYTPGTNPRDDVPADKVDWKAAVAEFHKLCNSNNRSD